MFQTVNAKCLLQFKTTLGNLTIRACLLNSHLIVCCMLKSRENKNELSLFVINQTCMKSEWIAVVMHWLLQQLLLCDSTTFVNDVNDVTVALLQLLLAQALADCFNYSQCLEIGLKIRLKCNIYRVIGLKYLWFCCLMTFNIVESAFMPTGSLWRHHPPLGQYIICS